MLTRFASVSLARDVVTRRFAGSAAAAAPQAAAKAEGKSDAKHAKAADPKAKERAKEMAKSFGLNMFLGRVVPKMTFPYPDVLSEEQRATTQMLLEPTQKFTERHDPAKHDEQSALTKEVLAELGELGAFGMQVPVEYGGVGLNNSQYARMGEVIAAHDLGVTITMGAHQSIGYKALLLFGTPEQKRKYLPVLASGEKLAAYCLTEPSSGSDAQSIRSRAELSADGKHYVLNGTKIWISNGGIAEIFTVFAQTPVTDPKTGEKRNKITAFLVERAFGGVTSGKPEKKMGIKASNTAEVYFENVHIPVENVIGKVGEGFKIAMHVLNNGRFGMVAGMAGVQRHTIARVVDHITQRVQFGKKLEAFGNVQEKLARMAMRHYATESMAYLISGNMDQGFKEFQIEAAAGKVYASDAAWLTMDDAIQLYGGMGFMSSTGLERVMRDLRIFRIFEGANDILTLFVALSGLQYAGEQLRGLQKAFANPLGNLDVVSNELMRRLRRQVSGPRRDLLEPYVHVSLGDAAAQTSEQIVLLGEAVEAALRRHGRAIIDQQFVSRRIGTAAIDIYAQVAALSRCSRAKRLRLPSADHEARLVSLLCSEGLQNTQALLGDTSCESGRKRFEHYSAVSVDLCAQKGAVATHPLGV